MEAQVAAMYVPSGAIQTPSQQFYDAQPSVHQSHGDVSMLEQSMEQGHVPSIPQSFQQGHPTAQTLGQGLPYRSVFPGAPVFQPPQTSGQFQAQSQPLPHSLQNSHPY